MKRLLKSQLSKLKFALGRNPVVPAVEHAGRFIPEGFKGVMTITADFELAWAPRYDNSVPDPYEHAMRLAAQERSNISSILDVCDTCNIPVTWATVGHLFLHACRDENGVKHPEIPPIPSYSGPYWDFPGGDWFEHDPCTCLEEAPEWYAPDLIQQILNTSAAHEIGCHTFSHIDCRDEVCPKEVFESEVRACVRQADKLGLSLRSFVHPGHTIGNLGSLAELGFTSYQTDPGNVLGIPRKHPTGLWELQRTMEFTYRPEWSIRYHIDRYQRIIERAVQHGRVCNFWFHPSMPPVFVEEVMPALFAFAATRRDDIRITTVGEYIHWLNNR